MTFLEIRNAVRVSFLNDPDAGFFVDRIVGPAVIQANNDVNAMLIRLKPSKTFLSRVFFPTIAGTKSYTLPGDFAEAELIQVVEGSGTQAQKDNIIATLHSAPIPVGNAPLHAPFYENAISGQPTHYLIRNKQIDLYPTPDSVYTISMWMDRRPLPLSLDDDVPAVEQYDPTFSFWIGAEAAFIASFSSVNLRTGVEPRYDLHKIFKIKEAELIDLVGMRTADEESRVMTGLYGG